METLQQNANAELANLFLPFHTFQEGLNEKLTLNDEDHVDLVLSELITGATAE